MDFIGQLINYIWALGIGFWIAVFVLWIFLSDHHHLKARSRRRHESVVPMSQEQEAKHLALYRRNVEIDRILHPRPPGP